MSISDEINKLVDLRERGMLSAYEFEAAKKRVLDGEHEPPRDERFENLELQRKLDRVDRDWQIEQENYKVSGRYGFRQIPTKGTSLVGGFVAFVFGCIWIGMAMSMPQGPGLFDLFPLFGVLFVVVAVGGAMYSYNKADQHDRAKNNYLKRRLQIQKEIEQKENQR